mmetsp:Transcript_26866/g.72052  ORF Transcript_26866/g.72052 Transcript_26866/m.72052 type:complete len:157 (+) Transcript_26866:200-670(+)
MGQLRQGSVGMPKKRKHQPPRAATVESDHPPPYPEPPPPPEPVLASPPAPAPGTVARSPELHCRSSIGSWLAQTLADVPCLLVGSRLAFSGPSGSANDPGLSGQLRAAKRTRLSEHFARFGHRSERQRALDDVCVCRSCGDAAPRALECVHGRVLC